MIDEKGYDPSFHYADGGGLAEGHRTVFSTGEVCPACLFESSARAVLDDASDSTIADEVYDLVYGDRQASYGHPASDFTAMGRITAAILSRWLESEGLVVGKLDPTLGDTGTFDPGPVRLPDIPPGIVALVMTAVKLSRESAQHKRDNLVDLVGYVACKQRIDEGDER